MIIYSVGLIGNPFIVETHHVKGYIRKDGTVVEPYYRDGHGNTQIDRTVEQGGGYFRSNPERIRSHSGTLR